MGDLLIYPTYFPSVSHFAAMAQADSVTFETEDNFQKQTSRNRTYIYSPNGKQMLNIPIKHTLHKHQKTKDVKIESAFDWQKQHFKSLEAAYRSSPFFEYFEDMFRPVFTKKHTFLLDLNLETIALVSTCLRFSLTYKRTEEYFHEVPNCHDLRNLAVAKKDASVFEEYKQVFGDKFGFLNNLSVLDLLFNEGRYALDYLERQSL